MSDFNYSFLTPAHFILIGIPGLEHVQFWMSIPLFFMYLLTVIGNIVILYIIVSEEILHKPMYIFLSMLSVIDLVGSATTTPKILSIFWFNSQEIEFNACLTQMFFIHTMTIMESTVLFSMAFDRYVAICHPLRYTLILTSKTIATIGILAVLRGTFLMAPFILLIKRLSFCKTNIIPHTYCEHMAVEKIACSKTTIHEVYGLTAAMLVIAVDVVCITLSYSAIVRAVMRLSSSEARLKTFNTCGSHICVILISYIPSLFSFFTHKFGHNIPPTIHIIIANVYILIAPMCNPIIYGVKTKDIKKRIVWIFYNNKKNIK